jgi:hypothetical protein
MKLKFRIGSRRGRQGGVALIVALVVLVVIGLTSAAVMRGALNSDLVANNTRVQSLASQAAQVALKYCESQWNVPTPPINVLPVGVPNAPLAWETFGNWSNVNFANDVPISYMQSELSSFVPAKLPQCMVQYSTAGGATTVVIVGRGFSPDYRADETGHTEAGSVVWLQYILALS